MDKKTALCVATEKGHLEVVNALLQAGADVNLQEEFGSTALHVVACNGHDKIVISLLDFKVDVNLQNMFGNTALHWAAGNGFRKVVNTLLQAGADVNLQDRRGRSALHEAAYKKSVGDGHLDVVNALLEAGADVTLKDKDGKTALDVTLRSDIKKLLKFQGSFLGRMYSAIKGKPTQKTVVIPPSQPHPATGVTKVPSSVEVLGTLSAVPAASAKIPTPSYPSTTITATATAKPESTPLLVKTAADSPSAQEITSTTTTRSTPTAFPVSTAAAPVKAPAAAPPTRIQATTTKATPVTTAKPNTTPITSNTLKHSAATTATSTTTTILTTTTAAEFTEQDRAALQSISQTSTQYILAQERLNEVVFIVAAHERTLQLLVSKVKECPSLFWFYPKKRELRNWLSNPAKCLFQDTLLMVVVCLVTLCVVQCGPEGVGWEVSMPKKWVQKWGPAIMVSIYVMQAAVLAGRVVGIPLPQLPSVANLTGLSSTVLGVGVNDVANQENMMKCLTEFASATAAVLKQQSPEMKDLLSSIQQQQQGQGQKKGQALAEDNVKQLTDDAYKSMHTFLTTGDNAKLGKLEDQLRGRMERVMAPNGDIEWVSVEGRDLWLELHKIMSVENQQSPLPKQIAAPSEALAGLPLSASPLTPGWNAKPAASAAGCKQVPTLTSSNNSTSWLAAHMKKTGLDAESIKQCEQILVKGERFISEKAFAATPLVEFTAAYLKDIGITARGLQNVLIALHRELHAQHHPPSSPFPHAPPVVAVAAMLMLSHRCKAPFRT